HQRLLLQASPVLGLDACGQLGLGTAAREDLVLLYPLLCQALEGEEKRALAHLGHGTHPCSRRADAARSQTWSAWFDAAIPPSLGRDECSRLDGHRTGRVLRSTTMLSAQRIIPTRRLFCIGVASLALPAAGCGSVAGGEHDQTFNFLVAPKSDGTF